MSCLVQHSQTLRVRGYRMTPQRLAILEALHHEGHLSPTEIFASVRKTGMTETTVYRTLEFLAENGIIFAAPTSSGHLTYELSGHEHHHIVCRACGAQMEIENTVLRNLIDEIEKKTGYQLNAGHLTLFGLCPKCQPKSLDNISP